MADMNNCDKRIMAFAPITQVDTFNRVPVPETDVMHAAKQDDNIAAFLSFSPVYRWEVDTFKDHYEVRFIDLRYRSKGHYPFVAIVQLYIEPSFNFFCSFSSLNIHPV